MRTLPPPPLGHHVTYYVLLAHEFPTDSLLSLRFDRNEVDFLGPAMCVDHAGAHRAGKTHADAHFIPEDLLERQCSGASGEGFLYP